MTAHKRQGGQPCRPPPSDRSKTHVLGKEPRFLRPFDARSTQKMLRHKALTRCPNPRQGTKGSASPMAPKGSMCPVHTWPKGPKRPPGVRKCKRCARRRALRHWWSLNDGAAGTDPCVPRLVSNLGLTQQGFSCRTQGAGQPGPDGLSRHRSSSAT